MAVDHPNAEQNLCGIEAHPSLNPSGHEGLRQRASIINKSVTG